MLSNPYDVGVIWRCRTSVRNVGESDGNCGAFSRNCGAFSRNCGRKRNILGIKFVRMPICVFLRANLRSNLLDSLAKVSDTCQLSMERLLAMAATGSITASSILWRMPSGLPEYGA